MSSTYVYRLLKSSWGIRIEVMGRAEDLCPVSKEPIHRRRVSVKFSAAAAELAAEFQAEIVAGLSMIEDEIVEARNGVDVSIVIEEVNFNEADFQVEGLRAAIIRWAEQQFDLPVHQIDESFDRSLNKHLFRFS